MQRTRAPNQRAARYPGFRIATSWGDETIGLALRCVKQDAEARRGSGGSPLTRRIDGVCGTPRGANRYASPPLATLNAEAHHDAFPRLVEGARTLRYNGYKVPLMRNLVKRAIRGVPEASWA